MYNVVLHFDRGPWWYRLLRLLRLRLVVQTDRGFEILINQDKDGPMEIRGYVGQDELSTKVSFRGSPQLVRRTPRK